nr:hypothetical protein CFP56_07841 [Quercus suber]
MSLSALVHVKMLVTIDGKLAINCPRAVAQNTKAFQCRIGKTPTNHCSILEANSYAAICPCMLLHAVRPTRGLRGCYQVVSESRENCCMTTPTYCAMATSELCT